MSKVRRAGSDMSTMSLDSLVSVGLNPEIYENQTQPQVAIESTEAAAHRTHIISHDTTRVIMKIFHMQYYSHRPTVLMIRVSEEI